MENKSWKVFLDDKGKVKLIKEAECNDYPSLRLKVQ